MAMTITRRCLKEQKNKIGLLRMKGISRTVKIGIDQLLAVPGSTPVRSRRTLLPSQNGKFGSNPNRWPNN